MKFQCKQCGTIFKVKDSLVKYGRGKFCSISCRNLNRRDRLKVNCVQCGESFETRPYLVSIGRGKYCSQKCYWKSKIGKRKNLIELRCKECKIIFYRNKHSLRERRDGSKNGIYCSKKCLGIANGRRLKGKPNRHIHGYYYKRWRDAVFNRDNYRCVWCDESDISTLQADHIKPWKNFRKLRYQLDNGRTLCRNCHIKTDTYGMKSRKFK